MTTPKYISTLFFLIIFSQINCQTSILGSYENQTEATERMGEIIDIKPDNKIFIYSKKYGETHLIRQGNWYQKKDTLFANFENNIEIYKIENENILRTFPKSHMDTIINNKKEFIAFPSTCWAKTISYFENGNIESRGSLKSISNMSADTTKEGTWTFYYNNGEIKASGKYKSGHKKGAWKYYSENGEVKTIKE